MGAKGDAALLARTLRGLGADLICPDFVRADGEKISSSRIKELLLCGDVKRAARLLGEPYMQKSEVKRGLGLAHSFGFPTVNIEGCDYCLSLPPGVYRCLATVGERVFDAIANVGTCPTVGEREKHTEAYLIGFEGDLYGEIIKISFLDFVREERRFSSLEELKKQIKLDIINCFGDKEN